VTHIGDSAFTWCISLTNIVIPSSVSSIGSAAFDGCHGLRIVEIPSSVTSIGDEAFAECSMSAFVVDPGNSSYSSLDGVLFDKRQTTLIQYPPGKTIKSYVIPAGVTVIGNAAFIDTVLTNTVMPETVTAIGTNAFWSSGLKTITIPRRVNTIGQGAFSYCTGLESAYFEGNAPAPGLFYKVPATVYYLPGTAGWGPIFDGLPTALWILPYPVIGAAAGTHPFGFVISWATNRSVVVEASAGVNSPTWTPLSTNLMTGGISYFTDPQWTNYTARFYRLRSQ
jgi:hypothetical protein